MSFVFQIDVLMRSPWACQLTRALQVFLYGCGTLSLSLFNPTRRCGTAATSAVVVVVVGGGGGTAARGGGLGLGATTGRGAQASAFTALGLATGGGSAVSIVRSKATESERPSIEITRPHASSALPTALRVLVAALSPSRF